MFEGKSILGAEIYSLVRICGAKHFVEDHQILSILVDLKFFNILGISDSPTVKGNKFLLCQLSGYFDLYQSISHTEIRHLPPTSQYLSHAGLTAGFKEIVNHVVKSREIIELPVLNGFLAVIERFVSGFTKETEYFHIVYEVTQKLYKLDRYYHQKGDAHINLIIDVSSDTNLQKIQVLKNGFTSLIIHLSKNIVQGDSKMDGFSERVSSKVKEFDFINMIVLDIMKEEESFIEVEDSIGNNIDLREIQLIIEKKESINTVETALTYRENIQLIEQICKTKNSQIYYSQVFKLISQKFSMNNILGIIFSIKDHNHIEYLNSLLTLVVSSALQSGEKAKDHLSAVINQSISIMVDPQFSQYSKLIETTIDMTYTKLFEIASHSPNLLSQLYSVSITEYYDLRVSSKDPFDNCWIHTSKFMMMWISKFYKQMKKNGESKAFLSKNTGLPFKIWIFLIIDIQEIQSSDANSSFLREFALPFDFLMEESELTYTNSFFQIQTDFPKLENKIMMPKLDQLIEDYYPRYKK